MKTLKVLETIILQTEENNIFDYSIYSGKKQGLYKVIDFYKQVHLAHWCNGGITCFPYPENSEIEETVLTVQQTSHNTIDSDTFLKAIAIAQNPELAKDLIR